MENHNGNQLISGKETKMTLVAFLYFFCVICSYYLLKPVRDSLALEFGSTNINILNILSMCSLLVVNAIYTYIVGKSKREVFIPLISYALIASIIGFWLIFTFWIPPKNNDKKDTIKSKTKIESTVKAESKENDSKDIVPKAELSKDQGVTAEKHIENNRDKYLDDEPETNNPQSSIAPNEKSSANKVQNADTKENIAEELPILERMGLPRIICYGGYYLWVNMFSLIAVCMFWSFMNDIFSVAQGKKLYAYIGYGGLVGGAAGSEITKLLVNPNSFMNIGTVNVLLVSALLFFPSVLCMKYLHKSVTRDDNNVEAEQINESSDKDKETEKNNNPIKMSDGFFKVITTPILIFMALEMFCYTCSSTLFSQQMNVSVETQLAQGQYATIHDARTSFWADIYGKVNVFSLIAQLVVTKLVMMFANPILGLLLLNIIQVFGSALLLSLPADTAGTVILTVISWTYILRRSLDYSTARVLRESVYIPLDREAKYQGKGFIDMVIFRLGDGVSSALLFGGMNILGYGKWIDYSILFVMALQFYVIIKVAKLYTEKLKENKVLSAQKLDVAEA